MERRNCINKGPTDLQQCNVWFCAACGSRNVRQARFCGGCGKTALQAVKEAIPVDIDPIMVDVEPMPAFTEKPANAEIQDFSSWKKAFSDMAAVAGRKFEEVLRKKLRKKFNKKRASKLAIGITVSACLFSGIWLHASMNREADPVSWGEFRTYISQQLVVAPAELDFLFKNACAADTDAGSRVTLTQVSILEKALRNKLGDNSIKLFPNPYFGNVSAIAGEVIYSDVALDHPVYTALQPLIELGVSCCDRDMRIRPYEKMQWSEWIKIVLDLASLLSIENIDVPVTATGCMSNNDLKFNLANLRRQLGVGGIEKINISSATGSPSRLDALSSLAAIIAELDSSK